MYNDWLILHGGALGDLALTLRFALHLPGIHDGGTLFVISRTDPGDLSACRPSIRRSSSEVVGLHWLFSDDDRHPPERLAGMIENRRVLSALGGGESRLHERLLLLGPKSVYSFDPRPAPGARTHILKQWRQRLESQGMLISKCIHQYRGGPTLHVPEEWRAAPTDDGERAADRKTSKARIKDPRADDTPTSDGRPILIHPGSGGRAKCWPLVQFLALARHLREEGAAVRFLLGPVELETWPDERLDAIRREYETLEMPRPSELVRHLAAARCLVSSDSGPAHLAALLETPTVTIFGPTASAVWRPLGSAARVLQGDPEDSPSDWGILVESAAARIPKIGQ
jgi:hypothetical protein